MGTTNPFSFVSSSDLSALEKTTANVTASASSTLTGASSGVVEEQLAGLSSNTFVAQADDSLAVQDAYQVNGSSVITSIFNLRNEVSGYLSDIARGGKWVAANMAAVMSTINTIKSGASLATKIAAGTALTNSLLAQIPAGTMAEIQSVAGSVVGTVKATIGDVVSEIPADVVDTVKAIGNVASGIVDTVEVAIDDAAAIGSVVGGLIATASELNLGGLAAQLLDAIGSIDMILQVVNGAVGGVVANSSLQTLLEMAEAVGDKALLHNNPTILADFSANFALPLGTTSSDLSDLYALFLKAYRAVDSTWDTVVRNTDSGPVTAVNMLSLMGASNDMRTLINFGAADSANPNELDYVAALKLVPAKVTTLLTQAFPGLVLPSDSTTPQQTVDPSFLTNPVLTVSIGDLVSFSIS